MMPRMYNAQNPARSVFVPIRGLQYHLLEWGQPEPDQTSLFMVHGWMDVADSFQFVVDALRQGRGDADTRAPRSEHGCQVRTSRRVRVNEQDGAAVELVCE
mgnify:CR=1 FL=1